MRPAKCAPTLTGAIRSPKSPQQSPTWNKATPQGRSSWARREELPSVRPLARPAASSKPPAPGRHRHPSHGSVSRTPAGTSNNSNEGKVPPADRQPGPRRGRDTGAAGIPGRVKSCDNASSGACEVRAATSRPRSGGSGLSAPPRGHDQGRARGRWPRDAPVPPARLEG